MKKLIFIDSIVLILIIGIFIFGGYQNNYSTEFNLKEILKLVEWRIFISLTILMILLSLFLSLLPIKRFGFKNRFFTILTILNFIFFIFITIVYTRFYFKTKKELKALTTEYRLKAEKDIKNGIIRIEYGGLAIPLDSKTQKMQNEIDSVVKTYGIIYQNSGCVIYANRIKAQKEYLKFTKPHLDKRNGLGWENRMKKEIEIIRNNYR
jgi:glucan phosphoethanolaminetransferase (alkaline phosphatase superfamily)